MALPLLTEPPFRNLRYLTLDPRSSSNRRYPLQTEYFTRPGSSVVVTELLDGYPVMVTSRSRLPVVWADEAVGKDSFVLPTLRPLSERIQAYATQAEDFAILGVWMRLMRRQQYYDVPSTFMVHSIADNGQLMSWDLTVELCSELGLTTVPVLFQGSISNPTDFLGFYTGVSEIGGRQMGFVVRSEDSTTIYDADMVMGKYVGRKPSLRPTEQVENGIRG